VGVTGCTTRDPAIEATLARHKTLFPPLAAPQCAGNCLSHAAKQYQTNFLNHFTLVNNVLDRAGRIASFKLFGILPPSRKAEDKAALKEQLGAAPLFAVKLAVDTGQVPVNARVAEVAAEIRRDMGLPDGKSLTGLWLRANIGASVRFVLAMAKSFDAIREEADALVAQQIKVRKGVTKGVKWVPTHKAARMNVKIDASDITAALLGRKLADDELSADVVRDTFTPGITRAFGAKFVPMFTGTIDTDGTSVSLHFKRPRPPKKPPPAPEAKKEDARSPKPIPRITLVNDPGRINTMTVTVLLDGKPFMVRVGSGGKMRPLVFKLTAAQYYAASGIRVRTMLQRKRRAAVHGLPELDKALSEAGLKTGNIKTIKKHLMLLNEKTGGIWAFAGAKGTLSSRLRCRGGKQRAKERFFIKMRERLVALFGKEDVAQAVMVWGCAKVSPSGVGNLTVPTVGLAAIAARYFRLEPGDEFRTSSGCCRAGCHHDLNEPRMVGKKVVRKRLARGDDGFAHDVRERFIVGLHHKRLIKRHADGRVIRRAACQERVTEATRWTFDGHGGESAEVKAASKARREELGLQVRYVRGLRFCQECKKLYDRDVIGSINIGTIWKCARTCTQVPPAFDRTVQRALKRALVKKAKPSS
jgi:hypothetical protein